VNSLLKELQHESHLLRQDLNKYQTGVDTLNALNQKIKDIEEESREIQADTVKEEKKSAASGLQLEAHEMMDIQYATSSFLPALSDKITNKIIVATTAIGLSYPMIMLMTWRFVPLSAFYATLLSCVVST